MKKADRQKIFDKYGGKCAYCGCELTKGWHVDHIEPIRRKRKFVHGYWKEIATGKKMTTWEINRVPETVNFPETYKWINQHWAVDGMENPHHDHFQNYMPACASCNINKHSESLEDFRKNIAAYMKHLNEISTQYKIAKRYGLIKETGIIVKFYFEKLTSAPERCKTTDDEK